MGEHRLWLRWENSVTKLRTVHIEMWKPGGPSPGYEVLSTVSQIKMLVHLQTFSLGSAFVVPRKCLIPLHLLSQDRSPSDATHSRVFIRASLINPTPCTPSSWGKAL
ncbi:mCG147871 [Mus musculus]|nr:mCG147871 [Mus musculus]